jgi:hypothetical protein
MLRNLQQKLLIDKIIVRKSNVGNSAFSKKFIRLKQTTLGKKDQKKINQPLQSFQSNSQI